MAGRRDVEESSPVAAMCDPETRTGDGDLGRSFSQREEQTLRTTYWATRLAVMCGDE
jgi:hypothetical protein